MLDESNRIGKFAELFRCEYLEAESVKVVDFEMKLYVFMMSFALPYQAVAVTGTVTECNCVFKARNR
jgi:hypothetical protein